MDRFIVLVKRFLKAIVVTVRTNNYILIQVLVFLVVVCVPACRYRRPIKKQKPHMQSVVEKNEPTSTYLLYVAGIECKQCVKTVLKKLSKVTVIQQAECVCSHEDYSSAYIVCTVAKSDHGFPVDIVKALLISEDFVLTGIAGEFSGAIVQKADNNFLFVPVSMDNDSFELVANQHVVSNLLPQYIQMPRVIVVGRFDFETKKFFVDSII